MSRSALVVSLGLLACNSDVLLDSAGPTSTGEPESTSSSTGVPTTGEPGTSTTGATSTTGGDSTTGEPPPPEKTCEDFLDCLGPCALSADPECIVGCGEGLAPDELLKVGQLVACVGGGCFESGACTPDTLQDPICLACLGLGLLNPNPPGCEAEADACSMRE